MTGIVISIFLTLLLATTGPSTAQVSPPAAVPGAVPPADVESLVARLSSDSWQERQDAADRLVQRGDEAAMRLQALLKEAPDPEVRSLAETAIAQIGENRRLGQSIITIKSDRITPKELFRQLGEQAGVALEPAPPNLFETLARAPVAIDVDHQPFWLAMREINARTNITLSTWGNREMKLTSGQHPQGPNFVTGAYMIVANRVSRSRTVDLGNQIGPQNQFVVQLTAFAEPKLRLVRAAGAARVETAVDDNGRSLALPNMDMNQYGYYQQIGNAWQVSVPLADIPNIGTKIAMLKGTIAADLCTRFEHLEVPDILSARSVEKSVGDARITVLDVSRKGELFELRIRAEMRGSEVEWSRLPLNDIALVDAEGIQLARRGTSASGKNNTYEATVQFAAGQSQDGKKPGDPAKLVWDVPIEVKDVTIPFEFSDIPIP
jgi:hypothetical protein